MNRPTMTNNQFYNNSAVYGDNVASYPVKIVDSTTNSNKIIISNAVSGLQYSESITVKIVDFEGQVVNSENKNTFKISSSAQGSSIGGTDFAKITDGTAVFDNLFFVAEAGSKNIGYTLSTLAISRPIIEQILLPTDEKEYSNTITALFRECQPGEVVTASNQCRECAYGTFSLRWGATDCTS